MNPIFLFALVGAALADVDVQVGQNGQLRFSPETVKANIGESVNFHFHGSTHSATESTARLNDPCHPLGGFDTGIQKDGAVQNIVISTHNSIYVHCTPHCGLGMVMIINPGPNDSVDTFRKAAIAQEGNGSGGGGNSSSTSSTTASHSKTSSTAASNSTSLSGTVTAISLSSTSGSTPSATVTQTAPISSSSTTSTFNSSTSFVTVSTTSSTSTAAASATTTGAAVGMTAVGTGSLSIIISSILALLF